MKKILLLLSICFLLPAQALAENLILTVSETENGVQGAWWPNFSQSNVDQALSAALASYGIALIQPATLAQRPRLSPVVYGLMPLSDTNAKSLASLFGTKNVLNGQIAWDCQVETISTRCCANAALKLITATGHKSLDTALCAYGPHASTAKTRVTQLLASRIVSDISQKLAVRDSLPKLFHKPVIVLDGLPDADTLVNLRKLLKRSPGINDVAEIWMANARLAIEINPQNPVLSTQEFYQIINAFLEGPKDNLIVRESKRSDAGIVLEIMSY